MLINKPTAVTDGENIEKVSVRETTQGIVLYKSGLNRVLLGEKKDGTMGLYISKEGLDVLDLVNS